MAAWVFLGAMVLAQGQFVDLTDTRDFVRQEFRTRLGQRSHDELMKNWPNPTGDKAFSNSQIPSRLRTQADVWIRRVVQSSHLPSDLIARFKGCRIERSDMIYTRFQTPDAVKIQFVENEVGIGILVKDGTQVNSPTTELVEDFVRSVATAMFQLTPDQRQIMTITSSHYPAPAPNGNWGGRLHIGDEALNPEDMEWWHQISFRTDADTIEFHVRKTLPGGRKMMAQTALPSALPPYRGRFDDPE